MSCRCVHVHVEKVIVLTITKTVAVVVLLAADFWNCRVSGQDPSDCTQYLCKPLTRCRMCLEGDWLAYGFGTRLASCLITSFSSLTVLQVDEDGQSHWIFESRDVSIAIALNLHVLTRK